MLAIASHSFSVPSETFIRNHAETIAPGNTVFVTSHQDDAYPFPGPVLRNVPQLRTERGTGLKRLSEIAKERLMRFSLRMPTGDEAQIAQFLSANGVHTVLTEFLHHAVHFGAALKRANLRHFVYVHGYDIDVLAAQFSWRLAYKRLFKHVDGLICSSQFAKNVLRELGAAESKIFVSALGCEKLFFEDPVPTYDAANESIITISRLKPIKGVDIVIRAFALLTKSRPQAILNIVGDGPERSALETLAAELGLADKVVFHGMLAPMEVRGLLDKAAIFTQHSITLPGQGAETFGLVNVEAMARGKPVIVSRHGAFPETVVDGETGFIVSEGDTAALARTFDVLLSQPEQAAAFGDAGRRRSRELYTPEVAADRLRNTLGIDLTGKLI